MVGGRRTLSSAFFATAIAIGGGLILSGLTVAAPAPARWFTAVLMDALLAFPTLLLALAILTVLKASLFTLAIALGLANIAPYARVAAAALRAALSQPHIEGARSIGAGRLRILTRHVLPAALPTLAAFASVIFGWILIYGAALAFLGLGGDPSQPDWGTMLAQGQRTITQAPWLVLAPGAALTLSVWLANVFADQVGKARY
jgi:peptide/nickel transport system permease protein